MRSLPGLHNPLDSQDSSDDGFWFGSSGPSEQGPPAPLVLPQESAGGPAGTIGSAAADLLAHPGVSLQGDLNHNALPDSGGGVAPGTFDPGKVTLVSDGYEAGSLNLPGGAGAAEVAATASDAVITNATTNANGSVTESVSFAGSNISFNNTFDPGLSQAYINCALSAEQTIATQWSCTSTVTLNEQFSASAAGQNGFLATNTFDIYGVSYAAFKSALTTLASHEPGNTYLQQAVAHLPSSDPSGGAGFDLALPYARMLGLTSLSDAPEDIVQLNTSYNWSYGQDVVNALVHEMSEGSMGRIGGLGDQNSFWSAMDLFRYNSSGGADYTDGRDGRTTYFSYNGGSTLSSLTFNNEYNGHNTQVNDGDTADFTQLDVFGTGTPGETNALSTTDIQVMETLGWIMPGQVQGPTVSASTAYLNTTSVAASSLFSVSDPNGQSVTNYAVTDNGPGHFSLNGTTEPNNTEIDITAAQLSQLTYVSVPGMADTLQIRAEDSLAWGGWTTFTAIAPQVLIQADTNSFGLTRLCEVAGQFAMENSAGNGPLLKLNAAPVLVGQESPWTLVDAALTATGYEIAWESGSSFMIWQTDSNGNFLSGSGSLSGTSTTLESYETSFNQDLNGDGHIGVVSTMIETDGTTSLVQVGNEYALENNQGNGPVLKVGGVTVTVGDLGPWSLAAAAQTSTGYVVTLQNGGSFVIWNTDANGNYVSQSTDLSATSLALESYENTFQDDLNGDGHIGVVSTVIETNGTTSLVQVANEYALENNQGHGPVLQIGGAPVVVGELGSYAPVAAAQTSTGYVVALQSGSTFSIWSTDGNGNYVSDSGALSGTSLALESYESAFQHDLNGDGHIGVVSTVIETNGTTSLVQVANEYALENSQGHGPVLQIGGAPVVVGELGSYAPVAAAQTSTGYVVALQSGSTFSIWSTDSYGNYVSDSGALSGTSTTLENYELTFNHDLNGDGTIGPPGGHQAATIATAAAGNEQSTASSDGTTLAIDQPSTFNGQMIGFGSHGSDQLDLKGLNSGTLHTSFDSTSGTLSVSDGTTTAALHFVGQYSQDSFHFADDGHGGTLISAAPAPGQSGNQVSELTAHDTFVFAQGFGQTTLTNFAPATDTLQFSKSVFADAVSVAAATHDNASGNAVITDAAHDTITLQHITTAQLLAHQSDFHIV